MVSRQCQEHEPGSKLDFSVDEISIHHSRIGKFTCVILKMPKAQVMAEAIFVAAVLLEDPDEKAYGEDEEAKTKVEKIPRPS